MIYTLSFHDHAPSPQIYFPSRRSLNVSSLLSLTKCMEQQRARSTHPREKHPVPSSRRVSNTTFTAQHSRGKTEPLPSPLLSTAVATAAARVNETIPAAREMPKAWARIFFPPLARDTSGAALTEDTARKRGKTTKQIKQTTTVGGLAICARAWKCFVPSLLFSLIEFCPDDDFFFFFFGLVDISIAYSFFLINCN